MSARPDPRLPPGAGTPVRRLCAIGVVLFGAVPHTASAQLISPGPLTEAHAQLEGMRKCTNCHEIRKRGIQEARCLSCHEPLADRLAADRGFHARVEGSCAECHKEHSGRETDIVRLDTLAFEHEPQTGYALLGAHRNAGCRDCHQPQQITAPDVRLFTRQGGALSETWLGVATVCLSCHRSDDPHDGQFDRTACSDCHDQTDWKPADGFDHDRARFKLTGEHRSVACADCHPSPTGDSSSRRYRPLSFGQCRDCHEDPHRGVMGARCTECHATTGWGRLRRNDFEDRFDHEATGYPLEGAHGSLECAACHDLSRAETDSLRISYRPSTRSHTYPRPIVEGCLSCHVDYHEGAFADTEGGAVCSSCHGQDGWLPSSFDLFRHNEDTRFELEGAHLAVPCTTCHLAEDSTAWRFEFVDLTCRGCHADEDPHQGQFEGRACTDCHGTETFDLPDFDHETTRYSLSGAHVDVACDGCHLPESDGSGPAFIRYRPLESTCEACHGGRR